MKATIIRVDYDVKHDKTDVTMSCDPDMWRTVGAMRGDAVDVRGTAQIEHEQRIHARMLDALRAAETWFTVHHPAAPERTGISLAIGAGRTLINE
jgi:hypothetical protein